MKAIKGLSILMLFYAFVLETKANPVDVRTAQNVAVKFMNANAKTPLRSMDDLHLVTTYNINRGDAAFYVFNTSNGFVIVSADDCATPILGYSEEGQFDMENIPIQMQDYLQDFVDQIQYGIENHLEADEQTVQQWELVRTVGRLTNNRSNRTVEPLITAMWDQGCYYNEMCPEDMSGMCGHAVTGCVATAMAQIMHYWSYPENGAYSHSYIPLDPSTFMPSDYPEQSVDFWATTYDWNNMPNQLDGSNTYEQIEAVATLMWHCGVSVDMMYSSNESGAYSYLVEYALEDYFNYSDESSYEHLNGFSDVSWKAKLKDCLNLGRPVYYAGSSLFGGHAFVCDGYDIDEMFHFNWGWSGEGNGYYAIGALNVMYYGYNRDNSAIFNIHPQGETTNYVINVTVNNDEGGTVSGGGTFAHGDNVTLTATANEGYGFCYWEENGGIVSTDPNYSFTANYNRDLVAVFAGPFSVTVSAEEGGVATGGGSYYYGESCLVLASANEGYAFSFWTDNGEVVSYNANYIFPVTSETHLIAHFALSEGNIVFADVNVKAICVANWDTDGNGMLSYTEAASVTSLGQVFRDKANIYSFDELQYFTNLTSIGNYAFYNCSGLTSLTFPNAVTSIGNSAFQYCSNMTGSLTIPDAVTSIGSNAFNNCSALTSITIGNSVNSIGNTAFYSCSGLTSLIILSETPPTIGTDAFMNVSTDIPVFVPCGSVEAYQAMEGWSSFSNIMGMCSSGTVTITADPSEGGTVTGGGNFEGGSICTVNAMPNEGYGFAFWTKNGNIVSHDANYSFIVTGDSQLIAHFISTEENIIFADANVKDICVSMWDTNGDGELSTAEAAAVMSLGSVFRNNTTISSFEELQYFIGLTSIGGYAFSGCTGLTGSLVIPNFVTTIGNDAFSRCTGLVSLTFSSSVVTISSSAFSGCSGLNAVYYLGNINQWCSIRFSEYASNPLYFAHNLYIGNELVTDLVIPETVIEIKKYAFRGATCLTSLTIPNSVTTIGSSAFSGCTGLTGSLVIPNSVTTIGSSAFSHCTGLTGSLVIPNSVTTIGDVAFGSCHGFTGNLTIPNSVTSIGECAFDGCHGFTGDLVIPNSVSSINNYTFRGCNGLTGNLIIPNSVTTIGNGAFYGCHGFTGNLIIPNSVITIGDVAFGSCHGFTGNLTIPNSVTTIGEFAFDGCHGFTGDLVISNSVSSINNYTFQGCNGFTGNLIIPNSVTTIGESAFEGCTGLTSLTIGSSVTSIGYVAFIGCYYLESITVLAETPPTIQNSFPACPISIPIYVPCGSVTAYQFAEYWSQFYNIQEGRYDIAVSANTEEGGSVTGTGNYCLGSTCTITATANDGYNFQYWTKNDSVVSDMQTYSFIVSESGNYVAHFEADVIENIVFADANVKAICVANWDTNGDGELSYAEAAAVTSLGEVFRGNTEITSFEELQFFTGLHSISNNAFRECNGLTGSLILPDEITSIGSYAFYDCSGLTGSLIIPNFVITIGSYAFYNCNHLTSLSIGNSVTSIGYGAFRNCNDLRCELYIPNAVTSIGSYAFYYCIGLTSLTIGNSVTSIGNYAFCGCSDITSMIALRETPPTLGSNVFSYISTTIPVYVPCESIEAYQSTTDWNAFSNIICISSGAVSVAANLVEGGEVTGAGVYEGGTLCTVTATPNEGYYFAIWTKNGNVVSYDPNYSFVVTGDCVLIAHFVPEGNIVFADANAKAICVSKWDSNDDGELSYIEAASVRSFRAVFWHNTEITSFDELQYFIGLPSIGSYAFHGCSGLTRLPILPDFVKSIDYMAFAECTSISSSLTIPNSVAIINNYAFSNCTSLIGSLIIGNSVISIGSYAFSNCRGITSMILLADTPPIVESNTFYHIPTNIPIYVPCESSEAYQSTEGWDAFSNIICISSGTISVVADPLEGGEVSDGGMYEGGTFCTVTATPNEGYSFINWTENGSVVSYDSIYNFVVTGESVLTAHFASEENIVFADANVKAICVANWDTNGDGELSYVEAASVLSLGEVFRDNSEITSFDELQFFIGLSSICDNAFMVCSGLTRLPIFPNSITSIGTYAFFGCSGMVGELTIPNTIASIGYGAFAGCSGFTGSLTIPNSVTSIGDAAFHSCTGLTGSLIISNSVTSIGNYAFCDCYYLKGDLIIPNSVTIIGNSAFSFCYGLSGTLTIPSSVNFIDERAFYGCSGLKSIIALSDVPLVLGSDAFHQVPTTIPVYVPCGSVEAYQSADDWNAFSNMIGLCSPGTIFVVADPLDGGEVSGSGTYEGGAFCTVTATPNEGYCFANWTENSNIVSYDSNYSFVVTGESVLKAHFVPDGNIVFADPNVKAICVTNWDTNGDGELSYVEAALVTNLGEVFRGNTDIASFDELQYFIGLATIANYAFYNCSGLTGCLTIPNSVTSIGNYAFYNCSGLSSSVISSYVTRIGDWAFYNCSGLNAVYYMGDINQWCNIQFSNSGSNPLVCAHNLFIDNDLVTNLVIPETMMEVRDYTFYGATCLTSLTLPNSVTSIGINAFFGCSGLTGDLNIPDFVTSIGINAFRDCSGFTGNLILANSVTIIGDYAFYGCSGFTGSLIIPESVISIGSHTFRGCSGLTGNLIIPNSVTSIGSSAFHGCSGLSGDLVIPNSVISIGDYAFNGCSGFTGNLTIPNSVTIIGSGAFNGCSGFTGNLTIPNSVSSIENYTFYNCSGFTGNLTIPNTITSIGNRAFYNCNSLTGELTIPNSVTIIKDYAFYGCRGFTGSLTIPSSVTTIGEWTFYNCSGFTGDLIISNSVTSIGNNAFRGCCGFIGNLTIGSSVTSIGMGTFYNCSGLTSMVVFAETPPMVGLNTFYNIPTSIPVYVPCGCVESYQSAEGWSGFTNIQEDCTILTAHFIAAGDWSDVSNWESGVLPSADDVVYIDAPCQLDQDATVAALNVSDGQSLTLQSGNTLTVTGTLDNTTPAGLVIKEGAQLINASANVAAMLEKNITSYGGEGSNNWYAIASPMNEMFIASSNFLTSSYDLYRFNETNLTNEEWENYKANLEDFNTFEKGRGYLYANSNSFTPLFIGTLNNTDVTRSLTYTNRPNDPLSGFNLIGNPFPHNIYKGAGAAIDNANLASGYYTLTNEGTWQVHTFEDAILPGQGILVQTTAPTVLTIAKSNVAASSESSEDERCKGSLSISVAGDTGQDQAYVYFGQGVGLDKVKDFGQNAPNLSIRTKNGDFAIAHFDKKSDTIELVITTPDSGSFMLNVKAIANNFKYFHLTDMSTGADIDLLQQPTYFFNATDQAGEMHFKLVYRQ